MLDDEESDREQELTTEEENSLQATPQDRNSNKKQQHANRPAAKHSIEMSASDFLFGETLGEGSYARVVHCRLKSMQKDYAMKILDKHHIKREKKVHYVLMEKDILIKYSHPLIVKLYYCFTDPSYIYMCMDLAPGGELLSMITKAKNEKVAEGKENEACDMITTRFYIAELTEALEYLHGHSIVHRDLKPENVLLTAEGHIKLADFGTALIGEDKENSFDGTALYVSPEILNSGPATKSCDLWALGCLTFQMLTGRTPFAGDTEYLIFRNITGYVDGSLPIEYPAESICDTAKAFITGLLEPDPLLRLGGGMDGTNTLDPYGKGSNNGYGHFKGHEFFDSVEWGLLTESKAPFIPAEASFPDQSHLYDGADEDWMFGGEATILQGPHSRNDSADYAGGKGSQGEGLRLAKQKYTTLGSPGRLGSDHWKNFLVEGEQQLFTGLVDKRKGLFSKRRHLVLTDLPRLFYVDPETMELKGEIPWDAQNQVKCTIIDAYRFDVLSTKTNRVYHLTSIEIGSNVWVDLINAMLEKQSHDFGDVV